MLYQLVNYFNNLKIIKQQAFGLKQRLKFYYLAAKLTEQGLTIANTVLELQNVELDDLDPHSAYKSPLYFILKDVYAKQQSGAGIAFSFSRYVPDADRMMMAAFEEENISSGFANLIKYNNSLREMQSAYTKAIAYPMFLIILFFAILSFFSLSIVPQITVSLMPDTELSPISTAIVWLSNNFWLWFSLLSSTIVSLFLFFMWALPNMSGSYRTKLDNIPPFNSYRIKVGCSFLSSLNQLTQAGVRQVQAIEKMEQETKNTYLRYRLRIILKHMREGKSFGQALVDSKLNFPDKEMLKSLSILSKQGFLDESLENLSEGLNKEGLELVQIQGAALKVIMTALLGLGILFSFASIYSLSSDMSAAMEHSSN